MNEKMALFLFEVAQKGSKINRRTGLTPFDLGIFNPYNQWPKVPRRLPFMDRPWGFGYQTNPHLSRPGFGPALWAISSPVVIPAIPVVTSVVAADMIHFGHQQIAPGSEGSRSDNKSFWSSVAQAMTGGFGTGGWKPY